MRSKGEHVPYAEMRRMTFEIRLICQENAKIESEIHGKEVVINK